MSCSSTAEVLHYFGRGRIPRHRKTISTISRRCRRKCPSSNANHTNRTANEILLEHYVMFVYHRGSHSSRVHPARATTSLHCLIQKKWLPNIFDLGNSAFKVKSF